MTSHLRDGHPLSFLCALVLYWASVALVVLLGGALVAWVKGG